FIARFFLSPKLGVIPTQPLIHNSMPLMKKAAATPRDNQTNQRIRISSIPIIRRAFRYTPGLSSALRGAAREICHAPGLCGGGGNNLRRIRRWWRRGAAETAVR